MGLEKSEIKIFFKNPLVNKSVKVLIIRIFGVLLFFSVTLFLTNYFDAELVGKYDFSRSLIIFLGAISVFGMHQAILAYSGQLISQNNLWYIKKIYFKMVLIVLSLSTLVFVLSWFFTLKNVSDFSGINVTDTGFKTVLALFFYGLTMLNIDVFRAINRIFFSEIYRNIIRYFLFFVGVLILFFTKNPHLLVEVFLLNFVILAIISTIMLAVIFSDKNHEKETVVTFKNILFKSGPMAVSAASFLLMQSMDVLMLTKLTNYETVAYYSSALKLTMIIAIVLSSVNSVIAPKISEHYFSKQFNLLKDNIKKGTRLIFLVTFPLIIALALLPTFALSFFGESYISAKNALLILLIGQVVNAFCGSVGIYLNMTGKQKSFQLILVSALILNIVLNYVLIPKFGMIGAAIATSASMILWNVVAVVYVYKKDKIKIFLTV